MQVSQLSSTPPGSIGSLVREKSSFPMLDLQDALHCVDREIRRAIRLKLQLCSPTTEFSSSSCISHGSCIHKSDADTCVDQVLKGKDVANQEVLPSSRAKARTIHTPQSYDRCMREGPISSNLLAERETGVVSSRCFTQLYEPPLTEIIVPPFLGRHVAQELRAPCPLPPFRASLVDGYGLHIPAGGWPEVEASYRESSMIDDSLHGKSELAERGRVSLKIVGEIRAGEDLKAITKDRHSHAQVFANSPAGVTFQRFKTCFRLLQCYYVTTGAPLPSDINAVLPVEDCEVDLAAALCWPDTSAAALLKGIGENIREVGADTVEGTPLMHAGQLVGPAEEALLASFGIDQLRVYRHVRVHTVAVGNELRARSDYSTHQLTNQLPASERFGIFPAFRVDASKKARAFEISTQSSLKATIYDSNTPMVEALLKTKCPSARLEKRHLLRDNEQTVQELFVDHAIGKETLCAEPLSTSASEIKGADFFAARQHSTYADVFVTTGGVSMGASDCMKLALLQLQHQTQKHFMWNNAQDSEYQESHIESGSTTHGRYGREASGESNGKGYPVVLTGCYDQNAYHQSKSLNLDSRVEPSRICAYREREGYCTVKTKIHFGRLNVKPGKPTMFASLSVFCHCPSCDSSRGINYQGLSQSGHQRCCAQPINQEQRICSSLDSSFRLPSICASTCGLPSVQPAAAAADGTLCTLHAPNKSSAHHGLTERQPVRTIFVFALPGNPCSAWVLFHLLVAPAINFFSSLSPASSIFAYVPPATSAVLTHCVRPDHMRPEYQRALLYLSAAEYQKETKAPSDGYTSLNIGKTVHDVFIVTASDFERQHLYATPTGLQQSSRLQSCCSLANGLLVLPPTCVTGDQRFEAGAMLTVLMLEKPFPTAPTRLLDLLHKQEVHQQTGKQACCDVGAAVKRDGNIGVGGDCRCSIVDSRRLELPTFTGHTNGSFFKRLGIVIVSDRCFRGEVRDDCAGTLLQTLRSSAQLVALLGLNRQVTSVEANHQRHLNFSVNEVKNMPPKAHQVNIVPDEVDYIRKSVLRIVCASDETASTNGASSTLNDAPRSVIFVCGGTGLSPRDVTPQALLPLFSYHCTGIEHLLLRNSLRCTILAALGRPCAGVIECSDMRTQHGNKEVSGAIDDIYEKNLNSEQEATPLGKSGIYSSLSSCQQFSEADQRKGQLGKIHSCGARSLVFIFPGSPKAVKENAEALLPVLPHALELL